MTVYATVDDITTIGGRTLTAAEQTTAEKLLETASAKLRLQAKKYGSNLDLMIASDPDYLPVVREVVINAAKRALNSASNSGAPATQETQSAMGYSLSMSYLNAGQSLYFLKNELRDLGLLRQKIGTLEVYNHDYND